MFFYIIYSGATHKTQTLVTKIHIPRNCIFFHLQLFNGNCQMRSQKPSLLLALLSSGNILFLKDKVLVPTGQFLELSQNSWLTASFVSSNNKI
jgi:hypothetical protein